MKYFAEKESENFLVKGGFKIIGGVFVKREKDLEKVDFKFPWVMKVSGKKIIHKKKIKGVFLNVYNLKKGKEIFRKLLKIKNSEGVLVQEQFKGKEFLLGIKKTPEFGHVVVFGGGGSFVEEKADVVFRVLDILTKEDVYEMILETRVGKELNNFEKKLILKNA